MLFQRVEFLQKRKGKKKKEKKKERNLYFSYQMHILGKRYHTPWRVMFGAENFKQKPYSL